MFTIQNFIHDFPAELALAADAMPWYLPAKLADIMPGLIATLGNDYYISDGTAIHHTATIEPGAVMKGPAIIGPHCFVAANAYLRGGVFLQSHVTLGPGCEVKSSIILSHTHLAHFNFAGDSVIGHHVNMEAGAIICNHWNERIHKQISILFEDKLLETNLDKFGALIGDYTKIGANAVLSPGTLLVRHATVPRLGLIDQTAIKI